MSMLTHSDHLPGAKFIGRFLLHTLPPGFARIRHYGVLASRNKGRLLPLCRALIMADTVLLSTEETARFTTDSEVAAFRCPDCGHGPMRIVSRFLRFESTTVSERHLMIRYAPNLARHDALRLPTPEVSLRLPASTSSSNRGAVLRHLRPRFTGFTPHGRSPRTAATWP